MERTIEIVRSSLTNLAAMPPAREVYPGLTGRGMAFGHHGEIIQGAMRFEDRSIQRFLVTMPCNDLVARATFEPSRALAGQVIAPPNKAKSRKAAEATLRHIQCIGMGGHLTLTSNIEEGFGLGSSTSDVVATIRAVCDSFDVTLPPETVARLAVEAELASDAIMFDNTCVMFAQRRGEVLSYLGSVLPPLHVLSVNTAANDPVDTLATPAARYCDWELQNFRVLCGMLRRAIRMGDPHLLGRVATASAKISQRHLPKPAFSEILSISRANGACGVQVSHSGTVIGLLFDAYGANLNARIDAVTKDLASIGMAPNFGFSTLSRRLKHAS